MRKSVFAIFFMFLFVLSISAQTANDIWEKSDLSSKESAKIKWEQLPEKYNLFNFDISLFKNEINIAGKNSGIKTSMILLPFPNSEGQMELFEFKEYHLLDSSLQNKFPEIRTFIGRSVENPITQIWLCLSKVGIHLKAQSPEGDYYIEPLSKDSKSHIVFKGGKSQEVENFSCEAKSFGSNNFKPIQASKDTNLHDNTMRRYNLAVVPTAEYALWAKDQWSNAIPEAERVVLQIALTVGYVETVFRRDVGVAFSLIDMSAAIEFDPALDGLTNNDAGTMLDESALRINSYVPESSYDFGHVFARANIGGVAYIRGTCSFVKAGGVSGATNPASVYFQSVVAHEMGHQFGANHTFNSTVSGCVDNRNNSTAVEPGSGSTIMSYGGLCAPQNVVSGNDPDDLYFHIVSIVEMKTHIIAGAGSCGVNFSDGNTRPNISPVSDYTIPISTPFYLEANASDSGNNGLTYTWEQLDPEITTVPPSSSSTGGAAFRSLPPDAEERRYFPNLSTVLNGSFSNTWEVLPSVPRTMSFGVTVRDNFTDGGLVSSTESLITFASGTSAFRITSQNSAISWSVGSSQLISWDVGNSDNAPVNCDDVRILLSTDGGQTFPFTLLSNTNNDGSAVITVPNQMTSSARIKIEAIGNIFYDINDANFTIEGVDPDDLDGDGVLNADDNCPNTANPNQNDLDNDGVGDVCDDDIDNDGELNEDDNCPETSNPNQADIDNDGIGDVCDADIDGDGIANIIDNCERRFNSNQSDIDNDGIGDLCDDDIDGDGVLNDDDNCPETANADQADQNNDGIGDACDPDRDNDGILNEADNCPDVANPNQEDLDNDGVGDLCDNDIDGDGVLNEVDNCLNVANSDQSDIDNDGVGDSCDEDIDGDGILNEADNCLNVANPNQEDLDNDGVGDVCDEDVDGDGILNEVDNCPAIANPNQEDLDSDGVGDFCDDDLDGDGILNEVDNCLNIANPNQEDLDNDGIGDSCDEDIDGDGILNEADNCPMTSNPDQSDLDNDGIGDVCDEDMDGDGVLNEVDNCPMFANSNQLDMDNDGVGDVCDDDIDGDGVLNEVDNCPEIGNSEQADFDGDGLGDVCDEDMDDDGVLNENDNCSNTPAGALVDGTGCLLFSAENFTIQVISETCPDKNNGQINITAQEAFTYEVSINGELFQIDQNGNFTEMSPGVYDVCIAVPGVSATYCYSILIEEGVLISGKSETQNNKTTVQITEGTAPFEVFVNGKSRQITASNIDRKSVV